LSACSAAACESSAVVIMTEAVKGPASYFPSIGKKYGRSIAQGQELAGPRR
jgi:hypothetical protein